jgi:hypothetical protein|tara:strand:+ start:168 stop:350 length:183 start_codon:yes stop_codon:yes gene_type:complete
MTDCKNIIIEMSDGIIHAVYCPDKNYNIHILENDSAEMDDLGREYLEDVEKEKKNLVDCY